MQDLNAMLVFARVVEARSFSAAATRMGVSKSAVSKQVSRLEDRLGARLLNRTTRRLSLTEIGAAFYERCARIAAEAEEAELAVTRLHQEPRGTLRVNAPQSFASRHLSPLLPEFLAAHPELRVDLTLADRIVDVIEEGYDVVIRIAELADSSLIARKLAYARRVVCAAPAYWDARGRPVAPADLRAHDCLGYSYLASRGEWPFEGPDGPTSVKVTGTLNTNSGDVLMDAATAGRGVVFLPTFICGAALADGRLEAVLEDYEAAPRGVFAVYPHNRHLSAKVRAFVDFLVARFQPTPPWQQPAVTATPMPVTSA